MSGDPLLGCLAIITKLMERPRSPEVLRAGLPDAGGGFTVDMLERAASRIGLQTGVEKCSMRGLRDVPTPTILVLEGEKACVLTAVGDRQARLILPDDAGTAQPRTVSLDQLAKRYAGYVITVREAAQVGDPAGAALPAGDPYASLDGAGDAWGQEAPPLAGGHWFWGSMRRNWWVYGQVMIAAVLINLFALASPLFIMSVYDRVVPNDAMETLTVLAVGAAVVFGFDFLMRSLRGYLIDVAGKRADVVMASRLFDQVLDLHMAARPQAAGAFANTIREFEALRDFFTSATLTALVDLPFVLMFLMFIATIGGSVALVPLAAVVATLLVCLILQAPLHATVQKALREGGTKHGILVEAIGALETIKGLGADGRVRHKWERAVLQTAEIGTRSRLLSSAAVNLTLLAQQLTTVGVVVYGVLQLRDGALSLGALIACVILSSRALAPMAQVAQLFARLHQARAAYRAIDKIMALPVERPPNRHFLHRPRLAGQISFRDVGFVYPGGGLAALSGASFSVAAGERVGILGKVGSGKTTVIKLLLGLYQANGGSVSVDGTDVRQIDPIDLRRNIGYLPQDVVLFRGSIRKNIAFHAPQASDEAVLRAARLSGLEEFLQRTPQGYDLQVGERGDGLSGGQRQAVALARALLNDPPMLLLDEPTSAMDTGTEEQFRQRVAAALGGRTLVLVTHRASLLPLVDRLIVLDAGRVVGDGPREEVLRALSGGGRDGIRQAAAQ